MGQVIKIRGHHIPGILEYFRLKDRKSKRDPFRKLRIEGYDGDYIEYKQKLCEQLYANPEQQIRIVNTLDDLCGVCSEKRNKNCTNLLFTDAWIAGEHGFVCGETYFAREFLTYTRNKN